MMVEQTITTPPLVTILGPPGSALGATHRIAFYIVRMCNTRSDFALAL